MRNFLVSKKRKPFSCIHPLLMRPDSSELRVSGWTEAFFWVAPGSRSSLHWPRYWGLMKVAKRWEEHSIDYILLWSMEQFLGLPNLFILYYTICHRAYSSSERYLLTITYYKLIPRITHCLPWFWEYSRKFARWLMILQLFKKKTSQTRLQILHRKSWPGRLY